MINIMQLQTQKYVLRHSLRYLSLHKQLCPYHEKRKENDNKIEKKVEYLIPTCIEGFMEGVTLIKTGKVVSSFGANKGRLLHLFPVKIKRYSSMCLSPPISDNPTHLDFRLNASIESDRSDTFLSGSYYTQSLDSEYWQDQRALRPLISLLLNHLASHPPLCSYTPSIFCTPKNIYQDRHIYVPHKTVSSVFVSFPLFVFTT